MRWQFLILWSVLWTSQALAWKYIEHEQFDAPSAFQISQITQALKKAQFFPLAQSNRGRIPVLGLDQVFNRDDGTAVFLKLGLQPDDKSLMGKILPHSKGQMFHSVTGAGTPYALFFVRTSRADTKKILQASGLEKVSASIWSLMIPKAQAESPVFCLQHVNQMEELRRTRAAAEASSLGHVLRSCAISAVQGLAEGAQDFVQNSWYVIKNLFTNPAKLWDDVVEKYEQITEFVSDFRNKMTDFFDTMSAMDPAIAAEVACSTISSVLVQSLIGGGIAKAGLLVAQKISSLGRMKTALNSLSNIQKINPESDRIKDLTREVIQCAR